MKIDSYKSNYYAPSFSGSLIDRIGKVLDKFIKVKEILTKENQGYVEKCASIAHKSYDRLNPEPVVISVKNGNKEFEFLYNNSSWHKVRLTKKGEELNEFEIMHVKNDKDFAFYSTGNYPCKISDEKYIKKYNELLTEWLPRLIKKYEKTKVPPSSNY